MWLTQCLPHPGARMVVSEFAVSSPSSTKVLLALKNQRWIGLWHAVLTVFHIDADFRHNLNHFKLDGDIFGCLSKLLLSKLSSNSGSLTGIPEHDGIHWIGRIQTLNLVRVVPTNNAGLVPYGIKKVEKHGSDDGSKPSNISMKPISTKTCKIICKVVQNLPCDVLIISTHPPCEFATYINLINILVYMYECVCVCVCVCVSLCYNVHLCAHG